MTGKSGGNRDRETSKELGQGNQERTVTEKSGGTETGKTGRTTTGKSADKTLTGKSRGNRDIRGKLEQGNQELPWGSCCCGCPWQNSAPQGVKAGSAQGSARCSSSLTSPSGRCQLYLKKGEEQSGLVFLPPEPPVLFIWGFCYTTSPPPQPDKQDSSSWLWCCLEFGLLQPFLDSLFSDNFPKE